MRVFEAGLAIALIVPAVGCDLRATKQAATPPPPKPAAVQPPAPEPQLSLPQTAVVLPSLQPVNPDAIPPVEAAAPAPAAEKAEAPSPAPRPVRRPSGPPKPDTEPAEADAPPPAVEAQPQFQPILTADQQKNILDAIQKRKREIEDRLAHAKNLSAEGQKLRERILGFLAQSDDAKQRGDYPQADALSERALFLARELQPE